MLNILWLVVVEEVALGQMDMEVVVAPVDLEPLLDLL